jgi:hypothetical protein
MANIVQNLYYAKFDDLVFYTKKYYFGTASAKL